MITIYVPSFTYAIAIFLFGCTQRKLLNSVTDGKYNSICQFVTKAAWAGSAQPSYDTVAGILRPKLDDNVKLKSRRLTVVHLPVKRTT